MRRMILTVLGSIALAITLIACNTTNSTYEEEQKKDEYLKKNFPLKEQGQNTNTPVETNFNR